MWQPLFVTLVVAVSAVLGQYGHICNILETGITTPNSVLLPRVNLRGQESYPVDGKFPCNGKRPIGLYVAACMVDEDYHPPYIYATSDVYTVLVKTLGPATVDIVAYCEHPIDKHALRKPSQH